jgi:hypothetical protein
MVTIIIALAPRVAAVVDIAVLLLTAIGMFDAFRPALCAVNVEVTFVPVDKTNRPSIDPLARRPFDGAGTVKRSHI